VSVPYGTLNFYVIKNSSEKIINSGNCFVFCFFIICAIIVLQSGELEIWLRKIGESEKADILSKIRFNGYVLEKLYKLFLILLKKKSVS